MCIPMSMTSLHLISTTAYQLTMSAAATTTESDIKAMMNRPTTPPLQSL